MKKLYQTVPWFNMREWYDVYEKLYSSESTIAHKKEVIDILHVWKARCPSVPSGIESTLCLLEVYIQDKEDTNDPNNDQLLRLAYATSLMRFVNHMLDKETSKGSSLYKAAKNLGVPDWIVELRHDTAHNNKLPSIELLREACIVSLDWLKTHYWDKHKDSISDYLTGIKKSNILINENKIAALLNFCTSLSIFSHSRCHIKNLAQIPDASMRESLVNDAIELFGNSMDFSNPKTVSINGLSNLMYLHAKKLLNNESALHVNKTLLSEDSLFLSLDVYMVFDNASKKKNKPLNIKYLQCFEGLLYFLHTHNLLQDFIKELINITCHDQDKAKCKLAALWVSAILQALKNGQNFLDKLHTNHSDVMSKDEEELKSLYYHWYPSDKNNCLLLNLSKPMPQDLTDINYIQPIVSAYNPYLTYFVSNLLSLVKPQIPKQIAEKICKLAELIAFPEGFSIVSSKTYTAEDIKMEPYNFSESSTNKTNSMEIDETQEALDNSGIWNLASGDHGWSICPIGTLPWQNILPETNEIQDLTK